MAEEVRFVDTTLRDGVQSLWASRLRTTEAVPALRDIDAAGFDGVELIAPASAFSRGVKDLQEDPWELPRAVHARRPRSDFRLHGTMKPFLGRLPASVRGLALERLASYGLRTTRAASSWNDVRAIARDKAMLDRLGIRYVADLVFSISPRHTDDYYIERARQLAEVKPWRVCLKDVGGLLDPVRASALVPRLVGTLGGIELELHAHSTSGLAPVTVLAAVEAGVRVVHVSTPPLANGYAQPSVFNVAANLRARGFEPAVDLEPLRRVSRHLGEVARIEHLAVGRPLEYDERLFRHQVPGGMVTNLEFQLDQLGARDSLDAALEEVGQVRIDLGYPIMITPLSQFVATQAVLNVVSGKRYELVSDEVIQYALGRWGEEAIAVMEPGVRGKILDRQRARELSEV
ncbi:MAG: biotin carboxyl carrier protein, partial [Acidimicrobiales bacterium]